MNKKYYYNLKLTEEELSLLWNELFEGMLCHCVTGKERKVILIDKIMNKMLKEKRKVDLLKEDIKCQRVK